MKKLILKLTGMISLGLGVIGAFLPLLPSTCFILFAAWAFSKSSPRFHRWLLLRSPFADSIYQWQQHRVIPIKVKVIASLSILVSFSISAWFIRHPLVLSLLAVGMATLLIYLVTRSSEMELNVNPVASQIHTLE